MARVRGLFLLRLVVLFPLLRAFMSSNKVLFFSFSAGEFLDEEMYYIAEALARHEGRSVDDVNKELQEKMEYPKSSGHHKFEAWGSQELADRINAIPKSVYESIS